MNNINLDIKGSKVFYNLIDELELNYFLSFKETLILDKDKNVKKESTVRIVFPEEIKLLEIKELFNKNAPTIFFLRDKNFLLKNNLKLLDFHTSLLLPIDILSFREILNILLTKYHFFKKSKIIINNYEIDSNQRLIMKDGVKTKLTEKEMELILCLNECNGLKKSMLLKKIWKHNSELQTHAFETHLHRLRKKIVKSFKDKNFITEKNSFYFLSK
jgi:DNA-binding response OmpR family regulator